jgi:dipeptidase E
MPIVEVKDFGALGLLPFQINPHDVDRDPSSRHMGETREERLLEYLEENEAPVLGLREGAWLRLRGRSLRLEGENGGRIFRRGRVPEDLPEGRVLDDLLRA